MKEKHLGVLFAAIATQKQHAGTEAKSIYTIFYGWHYSSFHFLMRKTRNISESFMITL